MPSLLGPEILARTMSRATTRGSRSRSLQYDSRSDVHSKVACWTVLFDLLTGCDAFRRHVGTGRIGFRMNHVMVGPINKTLDLVVTIVPPEGRADGRRSFAGLVDEYGIVLDDSARVALDGLPALHEDRRDDVAEVALALEAKACMTAHVASIPRLHAEILATGWLAKQAAPNCLTVCYTLVNVASSFMSADASAKVNRHKQPEDARRVVEMIGRAVPLARQHRGFGYDVVGVTAIDCPNDGSEVRLVLEHPAPASTDHFHYERMIVALCAAYRAQFRDIG